MSINVHKTLVECLNIQWHHVDDHPTITTTLMRSFLCHYHLFQ